MSIRSGRLSACAYPSLRRRSDTWVDLDQLSSNGIALGVETQVGAVQLNTHVVSFGDNPLLTGLSLPRVCAVASRQGN